MSQAYTVKISVLCRAEIMAMFSSGQETLCEDVSYSFLSLRFLGFLALLLSLLSVIE